MQKSAKKLGLALFVMLLCLLVRPMQVNAGNVRTGTLGENNGITWTYDEDTKTLTITGEDSGLQGTYDSDTWSYKSPFAAICEDVEVIKVQNCTLKVACTGLFAGLESLKSIEFQNFDTSHITSMYFMFYNCSSLSSVDLSNFDTSKVTDMSCMFEGCSSLSSLDVSNFDTSRVSDMNCMFSGCSSLSTLDLSNFDTSGVTKMSCMFEGCSSLSSVDVSNFDTSYVTNMRCMFEGCSSLSSVDVSNFDTSNAYYMNGMFYGCSSLSSLDVSKFNTSKVEYMGDMFFGCSSLNSLDLSNFDTSRVTNMSCMFEGCSSLSSLDVSNFDTSNVTDMSYMFRECSGLSSLDVSNFNTGNVTDMSGMFYDCSSLNSLDVSNFNTGNVTSMRYMFDGCGSLTGLDISSFDLTKVTSTDRAFTGCTNLARIKTPKTMPVSLSIDLPSTYMDTKKNQTKQLTKAFCNTTLINVNYLVSEIKLNSSSITVHMGKTGQLTATVSPQQALDKTLTWKSSNTAVAKVDANGKVTPVAPGTATITVTATDGSGKSASCTVKITQPVTGITLNKTSLSLKTGGSATLTATVAPSNASNKGLTWKSSDTEVATVDTSGKVTAVAPGTATITVTAKDGSGKSASCTVSVKDENPFADVKESSWQYPFVKYVYDHNIMAGKGKTAEGKIIFDSDNYMTRAEFVQTLYNKEGKPAVTYTDTFTDVPEGQWYTNAILWASQNGIAAGKGDKFDISGKITREEVATILYKYATNYKKYDTSGRASLDAYEDTDRISSWAVNNMKWAIHYGIMKGRGNVLAPWDNASRAECATMIKNFMDAYNK